MRELKLANKHQKMAKTKLHKIRAKNLITGQHRWFTEIMWNKLARMDRIHNGKTYPRQAWVQIPIERAPEPQAAKEAAEAARKAAEEKKKQKLSEAEKQAAREAEKQRAAKVAAEKQEAAKQAAAQAAKEANAAAKKSK